MTNNALHGEQLFWLIAYAGFLLLFVYVLFAKNYLARVWLSRIIAGVLIFIVVYWFLKFPIQTISGEMSSILLIAAAGLLFRSFGARSS